MLNCISTDRMCVCFKHLSSVAPKVSGGVWVEVRELEERLVCMCDDVCVRGDGELVVCEGGGEGQMERGEHKEKQKV